MAPRLESIDLERLGTNPNHDIGAKIRRHIRGHSRFGNQHTTEEVFAENRSAVSLLCRKFVKEAAGLPLDEGDPQGATEPRDLNLEDSTNSYVAVLVHRFKALCLQETAILLGIPEDAEDVTILKKLILTATHVVKYQRDTHELRIASDTGRSLIQELTTNRLLDEKCLNEKNPAARQLIFTMIGWTTMMYSPESDLSSSELQVNRDGPSSIAATKASLGDANRSLLQLLYSFGDILPGKDENTTIPQQSSEADKVLTCSTLCAASLHKVGIKIKWILSCSAHLDFDEDEKELSLFCLPTFCKIFCRKGTVLERLFVQFQQSSAWSSDEGFNVQQFMREILLSYRLIFGNDFSSRQQYRYTQRKRLRDIMPLDCGIDQYLDYYCMSSGPAGPIRGRDGRAATDVAEGLAWKRKSFSQRTDFPIFAQRFSVLQKFISQQRPGTLRALWGNKADINAYHTFRAVLVFGSLGVFLGLIQVVAGIIQAVYTIKAYGCP